MSCSIACAVTTVMASLCVMDFFSVNANVSGCIKAKPDFAVILNPADHHLDGGVLRLDEDRFVLASGKNEHGCLLLWYGFTWQESPAQRLNAEVAAAIAVVDVPTLCSASVRAGTVLLGLAEIKAIPGHEQAGKIVDLS